MTVCRISLIVGLASAAVAIFSSANTSAAEFVVTEDIVTVSGTIQAADDTSFSNLLSSPRGKKVRTALFEACYGGKVGASTRIADQIEQRRLATIARGQVSSGCAVAFMAGRTRSVDVANGPAALIFHNGTHANGTRVDDIEALPARLDRYTNRKLKDPLREFIRNAKTDSGVVFFFPKAGDRNRPSVGFCSGTLKKDLRDCRVYPNESASKSGILKR
ncbi:MAG: hypothetical protein KA260_05955 [Burkholderiales bacterium]|nr:hypothetical protein [Burkholderiales bacterium]